MRLLKLIWLVVVFVVGLFRRPFRRERIVPEGEPERGGELAVILLLLAAAACAVMFVVIYAEDWAHETQLLGIALGGALALLAAALIVASRTLIVTEHLEEEYPDPGDPEEQEKLVQVVEESTSRITRKRFLTGAAGAAGLSLGAALIVPAASLGPILDTESLFAAPWHRGRRLVDENGHPYRADDIEQGTFYTAYPEHASPEQFGAPVVVVRLPPSDLDLPAGRRDWAPEGILAYSKICTHAGCAVALYRKPLFPPVEP